MGYWESARGDLYFHPNMKIDNLDHFADLLYKYVGYVDIDECDCQHNLPHIHFEDGDVNSSSIYDFLEDHVDNIYIGEMYVKGEQDEDFWRVRKFANETEWRKEFGYVMYEGDDIPLWNKNKKSKLTIDATALKSIL